MDRLICVFMEGGPWPFDEQFQTPEPKDVMKRLRLAALFADEVRVNAGDFNQSTTLYKAMSLDRPLWEAANELLAVAVPELPHAPGSPARYPSTYEQYVNEKALKPEPGKEWLYMGRPCTLEEYREAVEIDDQLRDTGKINLRMVPYGEGVTPVKYAGRAVELSRRMGLTALEDALRRIIDDPKAGVTAVFGRDRLVREAEKAVTHGSDRDEFLKYMNVYYYLNNAKSLSAAVFGRTNYVRPYSGILQTSTAAPLRQGLAEYRRKVGKWVAGENMTSLLGCLEVPENEVAAMKFGQFLELRGDFERARRKVMKLLPGIWTTDTEEFSRQIRDELAGERVMKRVVDRERRGLRRVAPFAAGLFTFAALCGAKLDPAHALPGAAAAAKLSEYLVTWVDGVVGELAPIGWPLLTFSERWRRKP